MLQSLQLKKFDLKNLPVPLQQVIRPMLIVSLLLHGLVLLIPTEAQKKASPQQGAKKEATVKISQLPSAAKPPTKPIPKLAAAPKVVTPPKPAIKAPRPKTGIPPIPKPKPPAPPPKKLEKTPPPPPPKKETTPPPPPPKAKEKPTPTPTPTASPSPTPTASPTPTPTPTQTPQTPPSPPPKEQTNTTVNDPFAGFPQYPGAQPGSMGLLKGNADQNSQHTSDTIDKVAAHFDQELAAKGFQPQKTTDEADMKVYQVSKDGKTQYWHLFKKGEEGTVMLLAPEPLDRSQLNQVGDVYTAEAQAFDQVMEKIDQQLTPSSKPEDANSTSYEYRGTVEGDTASQAPEIIRGTLQADSFNANPLSSSAGTVFEVTNNSFKRYIILQPNSSGGTMILVSDSVPS
ncbi:MAG: hypothetical protein VKL59_04520 [Nostocaceae cyanobacterium]|nr:hypothetical protein [Nostocaceae cyanobacterium]